LQMFPLAVTCGNTFVLKPSEKDPGDFGFPSISLNYLLNLDQKFAFVSQLSLLMIYGFS
jgi:hypothetical protein